MNNNKSIYIIFSKTGTFFSNVIAKFTQKEYSHVSISLDDNFNKMYSFGRKYPNLPFPGGFVEENIYSGVFAKFEFSKCLIYKIDINEEQFSTINNELNLFIENKDNLKYNFLGAILSYFNIAYSNNNTYFCSQFVGTILYNSKLYKTDKPLELIKPMDFLEIDNKELVFKGIIKDSNFNDKNDKIISA